MKKELAQSPEAETLRGRKYSSLTPYNFAFNDPVAFTDPTGAEPYYESAMNARYQRENDMQRRAHNRIGNYIANPNYGRGAMRDFGVSLYWGALEYSQVYKDQVEQDAETMTPSQYAQKYGTSITVNDLRTIVNAVNKGHDVRIGGSRINISGVSEDEVKGIGIMTVDGKEEDFSGTTFLYSLTKIPVKINNWINLGEDILNVLAVTLADLAYAAKNNYAGAVVIEIGNNWGGITFGYVIIVNKGASASMKQHEFGHKLQYDKMGALKYYTIVGIPSLANAIENKIEYSLFKKTIFSVDHEKYFTETNANKLANEYFGADSQLGKGRYGLESESAKIPWYGRLVIYSAAAMMKYGNP